MRIAGYETHPAADLFPLMEGAELKALADDIKAHGLHNPVVLYGEGGKRLVLDGRNRLRACEIAGVSPTTEFWVGEGSPTEWVVSQNLHRRHLTTSQRAMVAAEIKALLSKESTLRTADGTFKAGRSGNPGGRAGRSTNSEAEGEAAKKAADAMGIGVTQVYQAQKILREATPEVVEAVRKGEMTVHAAEQEIARPRNGSLKDRRKENRGDFWRVPRRPMELAAFLRKHWTTREWRDFMAATRDAA